MQGTITLKETRELGGWFHTYDATLATTLSTLGFQGRGTQHVEIELNGHRVNLLIDKRIGEIEDLERTRFTFAAEDIIHPHWGRLEIYRVRNCHNLAKLNQRFALNQLKPHEGPEFERLNKLVAGTVTATVFYHIQGLYDQLTNWNTYGQTIQELRKNPFLCFSTEIAKGVFQWISNPLDTEAETMKRAERFARGDSTKPVKVRGVTFRR